MNLLNKKGLVIRHLPRHDEAVLRRCEAAGVATLHEAWDRQGLMGPAIRPIQQGVSRAGNAVTVLVTPGDNWMFHVAVEQCRAGDILVVHKAEARMSNELAKRERMRNGELGLDIYAMRPRLAEKGLRYYDRADEVEE